MDKKNIKLIACDIDGTLIPYGETDLPDGLFEVIGQLCEKGIKFIIASGRSRKNLHRLFAPVCTNISFICGNGGVYEENGKIVFTQPFDKSYIYEMLAEFDKDENLIPIIMGETDFFVIISGTEEEKAVKRVKVHEILGDAYVEVENPFEIKMTICKLGVFQYKIMAQNQMEELRARWKDAILVSGGGSWMDVTDRHTNKGTALSRVLALYGLNSSQLMVFGDNENDVEMLRLAKYGYVMSSGAERAKEAASYQCDNVLTVLKQLLIES